MELLQIMRGGILDSSFEIYSGRVERAAGWIFAGGSLRPVQWDVLRLILSYSKCKDETRRQRCRMADAIVSENHGLRGERTPFKGQ